MKKNNNKFNRNGFTMLEMIVAVGVFATVAALSVSSLLSLISAQKKALALQSVQDNLRFSMESIARDLRQGDSFYCGNNLENFPNAPAPHELPETKDCSTGGQIVTFLNYDHEVTTYRLGDKIKLSTTDSSCDPDGTSGHLCIEKAVRNTYSEMPPIFYPITSQDIEITRFDLYVVGSARSDQIEPRITIVVAGVVKIGKEESEFHLQTTVSSHRNATRD